MKSQTLLRILHLAFRVIEIILTRRAPEVETTTRVDQVVARVSPLAEKVLDRVEPTATPLRREARRRRRRSLSFLLARSAFFGALAAGGAAYVVLKQQRIIRDRYRLLSASLPEELLEVLAAPGGGGRLIYSEGTLTDSETGHAYPVRDGIPDFGVGGMPAPNYPSLQDYRWLTELSAPLGVRVLGFNPTGNAALAGVVAARNGWVLSVPCERGDYEVEMARANPQARIVCVDDRWEMLLETRRKAWKAGLSNLYFIRGEAALLPLQDASMEAIWTANGFHRYREPERLMTQLARVAKPGALVAGVSLVNGGRQDLALLSKLTDSYLSGQRNIKTHLALLMASGLHEVHAFRDGGFVRFSAVRM
jgi:SAM-dependent methyltransferase